jgi:hypothetical protein
VRASVVATCQFLKPGFYLFVIKTKTYSDSVGPGALNTDCENLTYRRSYVPMGKTVCMLEL